jgi:arylsulfatase
MLRYLFHATLFSTVLSTFAIAQETQLKTPPNIVLIVADDLGYGELGSYGQEIIRTPNLDQLAADGMRFTNFYAGNNVCAPSRSCLMTGLHSGHAYIRDNGNPKDWKQNAPEHGWVFPGQNPIPAETFTLSGMLSDNGYRCGAMGKWGLGHVGTSGDPARHGFDLFYGFYCQVHAHNHYPKFLWKNSEKEVFPGNSRQLSGETYSQDRFIDEGLEFIRESKNQPFFLYMPFAVPHLSIQVPDEDLAAYDGIIEEADYTHKGYLPHPYPRAGYAAMVTHMDQGIGQIIAEIRKQNLADNTLILFTSDNGPTYDRLGGSDSEYFNSAPGMRGLKGSMYEGGIKVPLIASWPGQIENGSTTDILGAFWDFLPTFADAANIQLDEPTDGISLLPTLLNKPSGQTHEFLYWESTGYRGQQAIRFGNYKAVRQNILPLGRQNKPLVTELYDLSVDPSESNNIANANPALVAQAELLLTQEHTPSNLAPMKALD